MWMCTMHLPKGVTCVLEQHTVVLGNVVGQVRGQGDAHSSQASFFAAGLGPRHEKGVERQRLESEYG
jgi:hypothetical protein